MALEDELVRQAGEARAFASRLRGSIADRKLLRARLETMREQIAAVRAFLQTRPEAERVEREAREVLPLLQQNAAAVNAARGVLAGAAYWREMRRIWQTQADIVHEQQRHRQASESAAEAAGREAKAGADSMTQFLSRQAKLATQAVALLPRGLRGIGTERLVLPALAREAQALSARLETNSDPGERLRLESRLAGVAAAGQRARADVQGGDPFRGFFAPRRPDRAVNTQLVFQLEARDPAALERSVLAILRQQLEAAGLRG